MAKALEFLEFSLKYNSVQVLSKISFELEKGETLAVCGNAGSGKDYLVRAILRMYDREKKIYGEVRVNEIKLKLLPEADMRYVRMMDIGVLPTTIKAPRHFTVKNYLCAPFGESLKKSKNDILLDAKGIMNLMGIKNPDALMSKKMSSLKPGELRSVIYSAALSTDPSLVISTGPDGDLPPHEAEELYNLIIKICKIKNSGFLLITSDISLAAKYCSKTVVLDNGSVAEISDKNNFTSPAARLLTKAANNASGSLSKHGETSVLNFSHLQLKKGYGKLNFELCEGEILGVYTLSGSTFRTMSSKKVIQNSVVKHNEPSDINFLITNNRPKDLLPGHKRVFELMNEQFCRSGLEYKTRRAQMSERILGICKLGDDILDMYASEIDDFTAMKLMTAFSAASRIPLVICEFDKFMGRAEQYEIGDILSNLSKDEGTSALILSSERGILSALCHNVIDSHLGDTVKIPNPNVLEEEPKQ